FEDDRGVDPTEPAAAELVSDIDPGEPQLCRSSQCRDRELPAFVPARGVRQPLLAGKGPRRLSEGPLLIGQLEIHVTKNGRAQVWPQRARTLSAVRSPRKPSAGICARLWIIQPDSNMAAATAK